MSSTNKTNTARLEMLQRLAKQKDFKFIKNHKKTISIINKRYTNLNSRKSYLSSVMAYVRDTLKDKSLLIEYNKEHKQLRDEIGNKLKVNEKSEKFIEWSEIIKYREELKETAKDKKTFMDYLILSLYTYNPPVRSNYNKIKIVKRNIKTNDNILILNKKPKFIIKDHKTMKTNGPLIIPIKEPLLSIIKFWITNYADDDKYMLNMSSNSLVKRVQAILRKQFKRGSINVLRKSYLTHVFDNFNNITNKELENITQSLGTSVSTAIKSYRKVDK